MTAHVNTIVDSMKLPFCQNQREHGKVESSLFLTLCRGTMLQPLPPKEHRKPVITFRKHHQAIMKKKEFGGQHSSLSSLLRFIELSKHHIPTNFNIHGKKQKYSMNHNYKGLTRTTRESLCPEGKIKTDTNYCFTLINENTESNSENDGCFQIHLT